MDISIVRLYSVFGFFRKNHGFACGKCWRNLRLNNLTWPSDLAMCPKGLFTMSSRFLNSFYLIAGACLLVTAIAKIISAFGTARILESPDPILILSYRTVMLATGIVELVVASLCLFNRRAQLRSGIIAWLASTFLIYRIGAYFVGQKGHCPCLGNLTDALHISPQVADAILKVFLVYLLAGGYATLFWLWRQKRAGTR